MKNLTKLAATTALVGAMATSAMAGTPVVTPVEPDVFVANPSSGGLSPWAIGGLVVGTALLVAAIADDDDDDAAATTTNP